MEEIHTKNPSTPSQTNARRLEDLPVMSWGRQNCSPILRIQRTWIVLHWIAQVCMQFKKHPWLSEPLTVGLGSSLSHWSCARMLQGIMKVPRKSFYTRVYQGTITLGTSGVNGLQCL